MTTRRRRSGFSVSTSTADSDQPWHDADNADLRLEPALVNFLGHDTNLHKVWDGELIDSSGVDQESYFAYLRARTDPLDVTTLERGTVVDLAMEVTRMAVDDAYFFIPPNRTPRTGIPVGRVARCIFDRELTCSSVVKVLNEALIVYSGPVSG